MPGIQEQEDYCTGSFDYSTEGTEMDGSGYEGYVLAVVFLVSDNRRRDNDGALATICDCISAVGRLLAADTHDNDSGKKGSQR